MKVDWFASKTPVGTLKCEYCPQQFRTLPRHAEHVQLDHRVAMDIVSVYPTALKTAINAAYGKLRIVK